MPKNTAPPDAPEPEVSFDLSHLETPQLKPFIVKLPTGPMQLRPIVALPSEGEVAMLRIGAKLSGVDEDDEGQTLTRLSDAIGDVDDLLRAACPSKAAATQLMRALAGHLEEKISLAMAYMAQRQAGEAEPSES
jgi:hypothetical protein